MLKRSYLRKLSSLAFILMLNTAVTAQAMDIGYRVDPSKIDDPDFYFTKTATGSKLKFIYDNYGSLRSEPIAKLPADFDNIVDVISDYIHSHSEQKDRRSEFYVGPNGESNGTKFNFSPENLPTKLTKLSFCFGFDPFVFTGILRQESHFKRTARSSTGAVGFTQLTATAIAEVSEQLGILGSGYHGKDSPEIFNSYIDCYLGPNKKWVDMWQDGTVPAGSGAYVGGKIKSGRRWLNVTAAKNWLNKDPDRNLIYGAILFKLYLGHYGSYAKALTQYNVSHPRIYATRVRNFYDKMEAPFNKETPVVEEIIVLGKRISEYRYSLNVGNSECFVDFENDDIEAEMALAETLESLYPKNEVMIMLEDLWTRKGMCKSKIIGT